MFVDDLPKKKIGYLGPRHVSENQPYEFYRLAPPGIMLVLISCGLEKFTAEDVERITKPLDKFLDMLVERQVDIINWTGVPLPLLVGVEAHDKLVGHIEKYSGKMASSQLLNVIAALKGLGAKKILAVNKWRKEMNDNLDRFLRREGMRLEGVSANVLLPEQFNKHSTEDSAQMAYELALQGLKQYPEADAVFIGGGAWLSQPVAEQVEKETGVPVVVNIAAMIWNLLHRIDAWEPINGHGRLLASK
jgi:maleate isomerase